jgi:uncharacterized membrane protein (DUF4010 family)
VAPLALTGAAVAAGTGAWRVRGSPRLAAEAGDPQRGPLRVREAALVSALLTAVALGVGWAQQRFGDAGVLVATALGAVADAHAAVATLGTLHQAGRVDAGLALTGVLVAIATNSVSRTVTAAVAGGAAYAARVGGSLLLSGGAAAAAHLLFS